MQPEPLKCDKKRCHTFVGATEKLPWGDTNGFCANYFCVGLLRKLMPEPVDSYLDCRENTDEIAITRCESQQQSVLSKACHGDLYFVGVLWISAMKTALLGFNVIPAVGAAPPLKPEKPPKMPYQELPMYDTPHKDYREGKEALKPACPEAKQHLMVNALLPTVTKVRKKVSEVYQQNKCVARNFLIDKGKYLEKKYGDFVNYMRSGNNMPQRAGAVALTSLVGLKIGWRGGIPRKMFFTGLGALAGGALAFPEETDLAFRTFAFHTGNVFLTFYNLFYGTCGGMPEAPPCPEPVKKPLVCTSTDSLIPGKKVCPLDPPPK